jgi:hypothetical protein
LARPYRSGGRNASVITRRHDRAAKKIGGKVWKNGLAANRGFVIWTGSDAFGWIIMPPVPGTKALLLAMIASAVPLEAATCDMLQAVYRIDGEEDFQISFRLAESLTAWSDLDVIVKTPLRELVLEMRSSNGYPEEFLVMEDPADGPAEWVSFRFFTFDKELTPLGMRSRSDDAPKYLLIPDLGSHLFYDAGPREFVPTEMWRLQTCVKPGP